MKFIVKRPHQGDRWYEAGEDREAAETEVQHLVKSGVLVASEAAPEKKAAARVKNKAAKSVANKASD